MLRIEFPHPRLKEKSLYPLWTTKDGIVWRLEDMTESHIRNCSKILNSMLSDFDEYDEDLQGYSEKAIERVEQLENFESELLRRGLKL